MSVREPGICPICGHADLMYGESEPHGETLSYDCYCPQCEYAGREYYEVKFIGHTNSEDPSGAFIE